MKYNAYYSIFDNTKATSTILQTVCLAGIDYRRI